MRISESCPLASPQQSISTSGVLEGLWKPPARGGQARPDSEPGGSQTAPTPTSGQAAGEAASLLPAFPRAD